MREIFSLINTRPPLNHYIEGIEILEIISNLSFRYRPPDFLCVYLKFKEWVITNGDATSDELEEIEENAKKLIRQERNSAWKAYSEAIVQEQSEVVALLQAVAHESKFTSELLKMSDELKKEIY